MKTKILLPIIAIVLASATNLYSQVSLFKSNNFTGEKLDISGNWSAGDNMAWNDKVNSIKVPTGFKVTVYEHIENGQKPGGISKVLYSNWVADASLARKISYVAVEAIPKIVLYKTNNFTGESISLTDNWSSQVDFAKWNDAIKSIKIPAGYKIIIYEHDAKRGEKKELSSDWVADGFWSGKISNISVIAKP